MTEKLSSATDGDEAIKNDAYRVQVPASLGDKQAQFDSAHPRKIDNMKKSEIIRGRILIALIIIEVLTIILLT